MENGETGRYIFKGQPNCYNLLISKSMLWDSTDFDLVIVIFKL